MKYFNIEINTSTDLQKYKKNNLFCPTIFLFLLLIQKIEIIWSYKSLRIFLILVLMVVKLKNSATYN